ncbi:MAG TPA: HD domain-containing phosphohydrolase [Vicinamibacteria bacterium]|nr:HD domain-containing phosphohydrolase [Vicinamibacteria bacterium]
MEDVRARGRASGNRPRVMVVDDERAFAETVAEILAESGFEAHPFSDPEEALRRSADGSYDVALLDVMMPRMSGTELAERLREVSPGTQVVFLTGRDDVDAARAGLHVGAYDFLLKNGFNASTIEGAVRGAAEKAQLQREQAELQRQVRESNRLLAALQGLGATDKEPLAPRVVLGRLAASAKELTGAAVGRVLLFAPTHTEEGLVVELAVGDAAETLVGVRLGPSEGVATFAATVGEGVVVAEQASAHTRYSRKCDEMATEQPGFLCAPLRSGSVRGALSLAGAPDGSFGPERVEIAARLAAQAAIHVDNLLAQDRSANFFTHVSEILVSILDSLDVFSRGHSRAVAALADMVSRRLGVPDEERRTIHFAALLHDIGKTRIHPSLLTTEARYEPEARKEMEGHAALGVEMLKPITAFAPLLPVIHAHHERWDGNGYPSGLSGENIPLGARVIAVADAFHAMTHGRPYASARSDGDALRELEAGAGSQFDPKIVRLFTAEYRRHREELGL